MTSEVQTMGVESGPQGVDDSQDPDGGNAPLGLSPKAVRLSMLGIGVGLLIFAWQLVLSSGFLQDDYLYFQLSRLNGFSVTGLTTGVFGSVIPGFMFVNTLLSSQHPISRAPVIIVTLVLYALIVFTFYRLTELLFGVRLRNIALTAVACCSGLLGVSLVWWTPAVNGLPGILADLLSFDGLIRHAVTGKRRYLVISVVSFAVGTTFYDPSVTVLVTFVLFTALFLANPFDWRSLWTAFRVRIWAWVGYLVPIAANLAWRYSHPGEYTLPPVASVPKILRFMGVGWAQGFVPTSVGVNYSTLGPGAWRWEVVVLGQALVFGVAVVSIVRSPGAWRVGTLRRKFRGSRPVGGHRSGVDLIDTRPQQSVLVLLRVPLLDCPGPRLLSSRIPHHPDWRS